MPWETTAYFYKSKQIQCDFCAKTIFIITPMYIRSSSQKLYPAWVQWDPLEWLQVHLSSGRYCGFAISRCSAIQELLCAYTIAVSWFNLGKYRNRCWYVPFFDITPVHLIFGFEDRIDECGDHLDCRRNLVFRSHYIVTVRARIGYTAGQPTDSYDFATFVTHCISSELDATVFGDPVQANFDASTRSLFDLFRNLGVLVIEYSLST